MIIFSCWYRDMQPGNDKDNLMSLMNEIIELGKNIKLKITQKIF